jgi:hypothetical protein
MENLETIGIRFVGYSLLRSAVSDVTGSLAFIQGISKEAGQSMVDWNLRSQEAANNTALAYRNYGLSVQQATTSAREATDRIQIAQQKYSDVVSATTKLIVNAAMDQAIAFQRVEVAHLAIVAAAEKQAQAEADLALIASRSYTLETDQTDLNNAANKRLAIALGERAIAQRDATVATQALVDADIQTISVTNDAAVSQQVAADKVVSAYDRQAAAAEVSSQKQIAAYRAIGVAQREQVAIAQEASAANIASLEKASGSAVAVGAAMMLGGLVVAGGIAYATYKASQFETQLILLHTQARVSVNDLGALRTGMLDMAGATGFSADALVKAMYYIESAGAGSYTAAHALDILKAAAMGAAVGHADLQTTALNLQAVMNVFSTMNPVQAMGALDAIIGQGMMTMDDLNSALKTGILATLQSSGITLADFGGALATMTDYAIPATQAANSLRMAIYLVDAPTAASSKVLEQFGLTTAEATAASQGWVDALAAAGIKHAQLADDLRKPNGIITMLEDLKTHFETAGLTAETQAEVIYKAFGGGKMGKAMITLFENIGGGAHASTDALLAMGFTLEEINTLNDRLIVKTAAVNAQQGLLIGNFDYITKNDPAQIWKDFVSAIDASVVAIGEQFIPMLIGILKYLTPIVVKFTDWIMQNPALVKGILGVSAAFLLIGGVSLVFLGILGMIAGAFASIATVASGAAFLPILAIFGLLFAAAMGIGTAAVFILSHWNDIKNLWDRDVAPSANRLSNSIKIVWDAISNGIATTKPMFDSAMSSFKSTLLEHGGLWDDLTSAFQNFSVGVLNWVKSPAFATIIADFAVGIPYALGLTLDAFLLLFDATQITLTALVTVAQVTVDELKGNWVQAGVDAATGLYNMSQTKDRMQNDMLKSTIDFAKQFDGENQTMWQNVYDATMNMTYKIGTDGTMSILTSGEKMQLAMKGVAANVVSDSHNAGFTIGEGIIDGTAAGMASQQEFLNAHMRNAIYNAMVAGKAYALIASPSQLLAAEMGAPLIQGIGLGVDQESPALQTKFKVLLASLVATQPINMSPVLSSAMPVTTVKPGTTTQNQGDSRDSAVLREIANGINKMTEGKNIGPTTGIEALIYEITTRVDKKRARGQKGYTA